MDTSRFRDTISRQTIIYCLLLFLCLNSILLTAQNFPTQHFTIRDGLPSSTIRCIYKDSRGLLWIGTDAGLCTFDSKSFKIFKPSDGMTANMIWAIAEDDSGNMWFGSYGEGIYKYDGIHFQQFTENDGLSDNYIRVLCWSKNFHCLVAGSHRGINTIRGNKITCISEKSPDKKSMGVVTGLMDAGNFIYVINYGYHIPFRFYPDQNKFINMNRNEEYFPSYGFSCFITSKNDTVFSNKFDGIKIYNKKGIFAKDSLGQIFGITEDKRGDLWMASWSIHNSTANGGIIRYDGKTFQNYKASFGITDGEIWTVFYDREQDILWVGTLNEGLFKIPFSSISNFPASYFNLDQQRINNLYMDSKNRLWISGNRELIRMSPNCSFTFMNKHPMIQSFRQSWNNRKNKNYPKFQPLLLAAWKTKATLLSDFEKQAEFNFNKVIEDADHSIVYSNELGLFNYREEDNSSIHLGPENVLDELSIVGDSLVFSGNELTAINPNFKESHIDLSNLIEYPISVIRKFKTNGEPKGVNRLVKHDNRLWYTSYSSGLWMSKGLNLIHFNESDSTISDNLNDICFDEKNQVIFGSNLGEICIGSLVNNQLKMDYRINSENGLQGSSIFWLIADQKGKLWAGTNKGLNCIDLDELYKSGNPSIRFLDEEDGYTGQSSKKAVMDTTGNLWIGAEDHLISINTRNLLLSRNNPVKIILNGMEINNIPIDSTLKNGLDPWMILTTGKITLEHLQNNLIFDFDILNYNNSRKDRFRYRLDGYDKSWNQWSEGRKAVYTNLSPGDYTFSVESYNLKSLIQAEPLKVKLTIRPPWWELWYFQALATLLGIALVLFIMRKYVDSEKSKQLIKSEIEKKITHLEMQALQAQMNPHFIFNCMNSIQYYVLANKMDEALAYLSDFSKVLRESLGNATLNMIPLEQEIDFLHSYLRLEKMRFPDKFDYEVRSLCAENNGIIMLPPMLIQPFTENSLRHGFVNLDRKGHLSIVFEQLNSDILKCTITDNGIGRKKSTEKIESSIEKDRPHSAMITETRIRLFNLPNFPVLFKIDYIDLLKNNNPCGLKVEMYLPWEKRNIEN